MAGGRNLQAFVRGYLKGEIAKQEQAAEEATLRKEAIEKARDQKIAFNSSIVKGVITENPEMFKELNMSYEDLISDTGVQTVLSYVKDKETDDKIKDRYFNLASDIIKKRPELFKDFDVSQFDISTFEGQQALYQAAVAIYQADKETSNNKDEGYRTFGDNFRINFIKNPNTKEEYLNNLNSMTNGLITFKEDFENLSMEHKLEFGNVFENMGRSAYSKHLSEQNDLKTNNENHVISGLAFPQIERLKNYTEFSQFREYLTALKRNKTYDLIASIKGKQPTMIGEKKNDDGGETIAANFDPKGVLAPLMTYLEVPDEDTLGANYPELVSSDNSIFKLTQQIISLPGMTPPKGADGKVIPYSKDPTAKSLLQLSGDSYNMPTKLKQNLAITLLDAEEQGMSPEDVMMALGLAINRGFDSGGQVTDNTSIQNRYNQVIYQLTKQSGLKGQEKIVNMRDTTFDALTLAQSYLNLITSKKIKTGAAGSLENVFVNLIGENGQLSQLRSLFDDEDADSQFGRATFRDGGYERMKKELDAVEQNMNKYTTAATRKAYGEAAALRIYLAYTLAKVFDPSGRVSDKDLDNVLSAFTGGNITSTDYIEGMLGVSIDRLNKKYQKFKVLSAYDPLSTDMADVRRLTGAVAYADLMRETDAEIIKDKKIAVSAMDISDGSDIGLKPIPQASFVDDENVTRNVYQVFYKTMVDGVPKLTSPVFRQSSGLYVHDGAATSNGYQYVPSATILGMQQIKPAMESNSERIVDSVIDGVEYDKFGNRLN